jgi:hypothetical protein
MWFRPDGRAMSDEDWASGSANGWACRALRAAGVLEFGFLINDTPRPLIVKFCATARTARTPD